MGQFSIQKNCPWDNFFNEQWPLLKYKKRDEIQSISETNLGDIKYKFYTKLLCKFIRK